MKHQATRELFGYWNGLRGSRLSPERNDIDPVEIRHLLIDTFILEVDEDLRFPMRLVGDRTNSLFIRELKGLPFLSLWRGEDRSDMQFLLSGVLDGVMPMLAGAIAAPAGRSGIDLELLLLPLRHNGRTHARLLGCLSPRCVPSWIGLLPVDRLQLGTMRIIRPEEMAAAREQVGFCETGEETAASTLHRIHRKPALHVIEGGISEAVRA